MLVLYLVGMLALGMSVAKLCRFWLITMTPSISALFCIPSSSLSMGVLQVSKGLGEQVTVGHREGFSS